MLIGPADLPSIQDACRMNLPGKRLAGRQSWKDSRIGHGPWSPPAHSLASR